MAFCNKCGTEIIGDSSFCHTCGSPVVAGDTGGGSAPVPDQTSNGFKTQLRQKPVYGVVNLENLPEGHVVDERYEVKEKIGQGGFGAVYRVFDRKMKIEKALKVLPEAVVSDREAMENIEKEATTMVRLNHPNIVRIYDFQDQGAIKYIDMEYVDGKNLTDIKLDAPGKKLAENQVKVFGKQIAKGLAYAHDEKVIHRDIKPQNILVSQKIGLKIMDFGISETVRSSMSRMSTSSSSGTLVYMSPEQLKGKDVGKEADIYSFGCLLYELVSGKPPFNKGDITYQIINEKPERLTGISEEFNDFLQKCLAKNYKNRYRNFGEVQKALELKRPELVKPMVAVPPKPQPVPPTTPPPVPGKPSPVVEDARLTNSLGMAFVYIQPGSFMMGSPSSESGRYSNEIQHQVTLTRGYYMQTTEVTQGQWRRVMGNNPSKFSSCGDDCPVEMVSWDDAQGFIRKLNDQEGTSKYRLPTEAEWEYACRAGSETPYANVNSLDAMGWYTKNSGRAAHGVAQNKANAWGLYDMHGNVYEWCEDWYGDYPSGSVTDPQGASSGSGRVLRGGSWRGNARDCRAAYRNRHFSGYRSSFIGFRLASSPGQ